MFNTIFLTVFLAIHGSFKRCRIFLLLKGYRPLIDAIATPHTTVGELKITYKGLASFVRRKKTKGCIMWMPYVLIHLSKVLAGHLLSSLGGSGHHSPHFTCRILQPGKEEGQRCFPRPSTSDFLTGWVTRFHGPLTGFWEACLPPPSIVSFSNKYPANGRHRISRPIRIVGPIQFGRGCVIYL